MNLNRRELLKASLGLAGNLFFPSTISANTIIDNCEFSGTISEPLKSKIKKMPKLYCLAYITPTAPGQENQEHLVAKYPMSLVSQDNREIFISWKNRVKSINPDHIMLGYQNVLTETNVPGPGHDIMRSISKNDDLWVKYPGGYTPTAFTSRRMYDYRKPSWKSGFIDACSAVLESYPYDGLFLDNCTVFVRAHPYPWKRELMRGALQDALIELRKQFPDKIIIGNCKENWAGLNGEMNEGRVKDFENEFKHTDSHFGPKMDLAQIYLENNSIIEQQKLELIVKKINQPGVLIGACIDPQHIIWPDVFDTLV